MSYLRVIMWVEYFFLGGGEAYVVLLVILGSIRVKTLYCFLLMYSKLAFYYINCIGFQTIY